LSIKYDVMGTYVRGSSVKIKAVISRLISALRSAKVVRVSLFSLESYT